jgi:hypothetical protein
VQGEAVFLFLLAFAFADHLLAHETKRNDKASVVGVGVVVTSLLKPACIHAMHVLCL